MTTLDALRARTGGEVVGPGSVDYESRRGVFNARVDPAPAALVACTGSEDVAHALSFARDRGLAVAVRGGGMSDAATVDGGVVIDVAALKDVHVDAENRTVRAGGGVTWAELDEATQEHGLAVTGGRLSALGVAGVALGSGAGWLERALGPTSDSLVAADVVLADGTVARAGLTEHAELLWALRGGGPGSGVLTQLELRLHPVGPVILSGFLTYPRERASDVLRTYRDVMKDAPDEVIGGLTLFAGRAGPCTLAFGYLGDVQEGERILAPLRALRPSLDAVMPNEYRAFQSINDLSSPWGMRVQRSDAALRDLPDDALTALAAAADVPAATLSRVMLRPLGGAMSRRDREASALEIPDAPWAYECVALWPPLPALDDGNIAWAGGVDNALAPYVQSAGQDDRAQRLRALRARYDPGGVFTTR